MLALRDDIANHREWIEAMERSIAKLEQKSSHHFEEVLQEISQRELRKQNVIIRCLLESDSGNQEMRNSCDREKYEEILNFLV